MVNLLKFMPTFFIVLIANDEDLVFMISWRAVNGIRIRRIWMKIERHPIMWRNVGVWRIQSYAC